MLVPEGNWLTGAIPLGNNIRLHLAKGGMLFSRDRDDYLPLVLSRWGNDMRRSKEPDLVFIGLAIFIQRGRMV